MRNELENMLKKLRSDLDILYNEDKLNKKEYIKLSYSISKIIDVATKKSK